MSDSFERARGDLRAMAFVLVAALLGCSGAQRGENMETAAGPSSLSPELRADYRIFALRCSKCHTLARPLDAGITDDAFWRIYVARMRHMQGSGITEEDEVRILRFLHHYSAEQRAKKGAS